MTDCFAEPGFYWRPIGGNNIDQISGHCYQYTDIVSRKSGLSATTIIVDVGKFDNHQALGIKNSTAAVPDIRELLKTPFLNPGAVFLTHSHPDHLNGIVHYLKAGFLLPPLYGGKYTQMILDDLYAAFKVPEYMRPDFICIKDGDKIKIGSLETEVVSASHTCFDSFGFIIKSKTATVYHTGDMKIDNSTYFRKPTNLKAVKNLASKITHVVADFCGITEDGFAVREVATFKKMVRIIRKSHKDKIFIPVYPTHPEMYLIAFLAALKLRKNVVFYGSDDFYGYLELMRNYGISFEKMAGNRIKVFEGEPQSPDALGESFAVIGDYNDIGNFFGDTPDNSFGIITARTFFNPLKGQFNSRNIKFVTVQEVPELQGYGHGFIGDYEYLNNLLRKPVFIPTHCPCYIIDSCRPLMQYLGLNLIETTPKNNQLYRLEPGKCTLTAENPASWLVVSYSGSFASFSEVWQKPTSGEGFLKRTFSARRCRNKFKMLLHLRRKRG